MDRQTIRVRVDFTWDDFGRRALAHRLGRHGELATRDECRLHSWMSGESENDDMSHEYTFCEEGCQPAR